MAYKLAQKPPRAQASQRAGRAAYSYRTMTRYTPKQFRPDTTRKQYKAANWRPYVSPFQQTKNFFKGQFSNATVMRLGGAGMQEQKSNWEKYGTTYKPNADPSTTLKIWGGFDPNLPQSMQKTRAEALKTILGRGNYGKQMSGEGWSGGFGI